uniref:YDG domain-containing protein n=1 Tax=Noccaea caerulescens TaxID=107243 RepID=A0A1J3HUV4_NOCCA
MNRSQKRPIVYAIRDFPFGCGTQTSVPVKKSPRRSDAVVKNPSVDHVVVAAPPRPTGASSLKEEEEFKNSKPETTCVKHEQSFQNSAHGYVVVVAGPKLKGTCSKQEPQFRDSDHAHDHREPTPREKVLDVLRVFKQVYRQLDEDKQARRGGDSFDATARIDLKTQAVLERMGKRVNTYKKIGQVPGIQVGDEFQYKTELRLVGLHFKTMCGIDYVKMGDVNFATSIVASEGYDYDDKFDADVVTYTGEGGNVICKGKKSEDQKMVKGNLALANSMRHKSEVRVIRGQERLDKKGKRYVYDGLYLVDKYWSEKGDSGKSLYRFKLCRIPGQPPLT